MPTKSGVSASEPPLRELTPAADIDAISSAAHSDPFAVLGIHESGTGFLARCFIPGAESVTAYARGRKAGDLQRRNKAGFFDGLLNLRQRQPLVYLARAGTREWRVPDAYCYGPVL